MKRLTTLALLALVALPVYADGDADKKKTDDAPETPALFGGARSADVDDVFGDNPDDLWRADVEEALLFLHTRQEDILKRLTKVEQVLLQVKTASGAVAVRPMPVQGGLGHFQLGPGEQLLGYNDPGTGSWVSTQAQPTTQTSYKPPPTNTYHRAAATQYRGGGSTGGHVTSYRPTQYWQQSVAMYPQSITARQVVQPVVTQRYASSQPVVTYASDYATVQTVTNDGRTRGTVALGSRTRARAVQRQVARQTRQTAAQASRAAASSAWSAAMLGTGGCPGGVCRVQTW